MTRALSHTGAQLYRLPYELLAATSAKVRTVIPSTKLSRGRVDRNRYYLDLTQFDRQEVERDLQSILARLGLPAAARPVFDSAYEQFGRLRFVGVGASRGRMAYRLYVGWGSHERVQQEVARSIDWVPGREEFLVKIYDSLGGVSRRHRVALLREHLGVGEEVGLESPGSTSETVARAVTAITDRAWGNLHGVLVRELDGPRRSVAFNYYRVAHTTKDDIEDELYRIAAALEIRETELRHWLEETRGYRVNDVATGIGWDGEPFVTIYHGLLDEPPPLAEDLDRLPHEPVGGRSPSPSGPPAGPSPEPAPTRQSSGSIGVSDGAPIENPAKSPVTRPADPALVYSVGTLVHAFSSEECRESFVQAGVSDPEDPAALLAYLDEHPYAAQAVDWLVTIGATVLYALRPDGAFAADTYQRIRDFLALQVKGKADLASFPGVLGGTTLLDGGQRVPLLVPDLRGMLSWNVERLIERAEQDSELPEAKEKGDGERKKVRNELRNFLDRIYYELRNNGLSGPDRALNYAATNSFSFLRVFWRSFLENRVLDTVGVEPSPICPPGAECYDVVLTFFDPRNRLEKAREVVRFTVDVAQVLPVLADKPRSWFIY